MINLSILVKEDGNIISEFSSFIKPVPPLSKAEKEILTIPYSTLGTAPPLCDITFSIVDLLENAQTVFMDRFSQSVFRKAFKEIGYPIGSGTFILEKMFKSIYKSKVKFDLENALTTLHLGDISEIQDECLSMVKLFDALQEINGTSSLSVTKDSGIKESSKVNLEDLPTRPGVYLFRNEQGEIIYVGKAKNISKRVRSHFSSTLPFEKKLCGQTAMVDFEETGSETIALLLESHYITSLSPEFNSQQKEIIDPFIIVSKEDSKGILRIQPVQKSYIDSENEFYYNRDSVISKIIEVQRKFFLCKRFAGIERTASKCSDPIFCKGICNGQENKEEYNERVKKALAFIYDQRPSYILKLPGRTNFEAGLILVKHGIYQGFGFIENEAHINSIADLESFIRPFKHNYFTSRIIDQHFKNHFRNKENLISIG